MALTVRHIIRELADDSSCN
ncbi:uncharacterized protein G2W53_003756 [Senna tora]|uniref:Uncharacterized protein n=1 Tax=Senna tora TaxID=362788 RepID=A0A834X894_9FABA|nr:uncharacterized protein G2W53_039623 [Senna tora]KAF7831669.1 uncharacterized protein G2W53_014002 [Senna tora]KAF7839233.1 uncharacterized protein G2W53_007715 [Senna tora]KAF7839247.1 uncharacterized protein G2W53_007729 [Senna tora]KAF7841458.1 uncharacterized protein G2W53_003756 [Senna tora]